MHHVANLDLIMLIVVLFGAVCHSFVAPPLPQGVWRSMVVNGKWSSSSSSSSSLHMTVTPIGVFCPFRSNPPQETDAKVMDTTALDHQAEYVDTEMTKVQMDFQMGKDLDTNQLFRLADAMDQVVSNWETVVERFTRKDDFQSRESYKLFTQLQLENHGMTCEGVTNMMRWQSSCFRAMALNAPPPLPPKDLDLQRMMQSSTANSNSNGNAKPPSPMTVMTAFEAMTSQPFEKSAFKTDTIQDEYDQLCRDHKDLIDLGRLYSNFDPSGKLAFLDQLERIEDRWDVFFARFSLMGVLNPEFVAQCHTFLACMNVDEAGYRKLLKKAHDLMRQEAEEERQNFSY